MENCGCITCLKEKDKKRQEAGEELFIPSHRTMMVLCQTCGNKRCPHANDHKNTCTNSNDVGQPGSAY